MKKILMSLTIVALFATLSFAQAPAPAKATAPAAAAKVEAKVAAPAKAVKAEAKVVAPAAATDAAAPMAAPKKKMRKAKAAASSSAMPSTKMTFKCPKGDALSDAGGKCPKCGTEMEAMMPMAAPKMAKKASAKKEMKEMPKADEVKKEEKKGY